MPDNYPDGVGLRSRVLAKVADFVRADSLPTLVAGDFSDVSWPATIHQLTCTGQLSDVNWGCGLYNTFDARWPLSHFFVKAPWRVVELRRLPDVVPPLLAVHRVGAAGEVRPLLKLFF